MTADVSNRVTDGAAAARAGGGRAVGRAVAVIQGVLGHDQIQNQAAPPVPQVRDSLGLTYDVSFECTMFDRVRGGWFSVHVTSAPPKIYDALDASVAVLRDIALSPVNRRELSRCVAQQPWECCMGRVYAWGVPVPMCARAYVTSAPAKVRSALGASVGALRGECLTCCLRYLACHMWARGSCHGVHGGGGGGGVYISMHATH